MHDYEKLGAFYLGRSYDPIARAPTEETLLYDAKDLTTHAVCVGMTGSGKTGLCVSLLEEAAIDGVPAIAIDPKGDLGNLMLTFPQLRPTDFEPWVDPGEARRKGMTVERYAADRARLWAKGLGSWDQDGDRIQRLRDAAEVAIYTPGSNAGLPLTVLRSFAAPSDAVLGDAEALRERIASAVSGLLALLGVDADPIRSREHILLANILDRAWRAGRSLDLAGLIREIQTPPFDRIGVMEVESFFPARDRFELAMMLNNLLASPGFSVWMEGEPLDIDRLLYTPAGRPRIAVLSIAHLSEAERMFFVTILLNEVVAWMRAQPGTSSLRALLYMDEIFGYFPPTAAPPSKQPMLTLLKQARAYGLGVVLATQNPVDLDYKGLSNTGTWFLGRLQTERDKMRVLEGLEGAAASTGLAFDRARMEETLAGLGSRVFLMNNVHDDQPVLFHTRWAMSYLRGPLTRTQIRTLMDPHRDAAAAAAASAPPARVAAVAPVVPPAPLAAAPPGLSAAPPALPPGIRQRFLALVGAVPAGATVVYRPALFGVTRLHYVRASANVDEWHDVALLARLGADAPSDPWDGAEPLASPALAFDDAPDARGVFAALPSAAGRTSAYGSWSKALANHLYRTRPATVLKSAALKEHSGLGESERDFRVRLRQDLHEQRDLALEKLRNKYAPKLKTLQDRVRRAEARVGREKSQLKQQGFQTAISFGATLVGALFGRKVTSAGNVGRAASTLRGAGRTARERDDIARAEANVEAIEARLQEMEAEFQKALESVREEADVDALEFDEITIRARKGDLSVKQLDLVWAPYLVGADGLAEPAFAL